MTKSLEQLMAEAADRLAQQQAAEQAAHEAELAKKGLTVEDIADLFNQFEQKIDQKLETVKKAQEEEPVQKARTSNRRSDVQSGADIQSNPAAYIVAKARSGEALSPQDKELAWGLMKHVLITGMISGESEEEITLDF